jgi:succinyl-diaminopimelate desuccinylase
MKSVDLARDITALNTINPPGQEQACAHLLGALLEDAGFTTEYYEFADTRSTLIARLKGTSDSLPICFTGHLDTVPLGATPWTKDPFNGETDGDKLFGRGISDMKAGVAAIVRAAMDLGNQGTPRAGMTLVLTAGEETCCEGAYYVAQQGVLGEAGAVVVGEPTSNYPIVAHKGSVRFRVTTRGKTAHASMPDLGVNAIYKAADAIKVLQAFDFQKTPHPLLGAPTLNIGNITGGQNINSVPDITTMGIDIRYLPDQTSEEIEAQLRAALGPEVEIELIEHACSIETAPDNPWIQNVNRIMEPMLSEPVEPRGGPYFTDASALTPAYGHPPTVILGPGETAQAHQTNEYCYMTRIDEATQAYVDIARKWCE